MTTAPRQVSTIAHSLMGALLNDWRPVVFAEPGSDLGGCEGFQVVQNEAKLGIWFNWKTMAQRLLDDNPSATHILTMQDDCVLVPNARRLVEEFIPAWPDDCGLVSLYLPSKLSADRKGRKKVRGIHPIPYMLYQSFHGSLAVVYRRETLDRILKHRTAERWGKTNRFPETIKDDDICVGNCIQAMRLKLYYAFPSCSQHISPYSTRGNFSNTGTRQANWVAEDAMVDCRPEFCEPVPAG